MTEDKDISTVVSQSLLSIMWKWMKRLMGIIILSVVTIYILLQSELVQNFLVTKLTKYIADTTGADISAERIKLDPFDGLVLDNVVIISNPQDTLLFGGDINISLRKNLFYLFNNELDLSYVGFNNFRLNIITKEGEENSNLTLFFEKFLKTKQSGKAKPPLQLSMQLLEFGNIGINLRDENKGVAQYIYVNGGIIDINYIDWTCNELDINKILLDQPRFMQYKFQEDCREKVDVVELVETMNSVVKTEPWKIVLRDFDIHKGYVGIKDDTRPKPSESATSLDFHNFHFEKINLSLKDFRFVQGESVFGHLKALSALDNTGFSINNIQCDSIQASNTFLTFPNYHIDMGNTHVKHKFTISYPSFESLKNIFEEVIFSAQFDESQIVLADLEHFVPSLGKLKFIADNRKEVIYLEGRYFGKIANLAGREVDVKLGNKLSLAGSFNTRDLLDPNNTVLNVKLDRFETSMSKLKNLIPGFNLPPNFEKLGGINFTGRFDGYYQDFVAYGKVNTVLGAAELDMRLDVTSGVEKARYSGNLNLTNFNLGKWTDNTDLGFVNFKSKVQDGQGLTLNTLSTSLSATVKSLDYKKYQYKDFIVNGKLEKNTFNGTFEIHDSNIDFIFDGSYEYLEAKSFLDFESKIKRIDLFALNLSKKPLTLQGNMKIKTVGNTINDFTGNVDVKDFYLLEGDSTYLLKNIAISSRQTINDGKELYIESELGKIEMDGEYNIQDVVKTVRRVLRVNYPSMTETWGELALSNTKDQKFNFNILLKDSKNFMSLLGLHQSHFKDLAIKGMIDSYRNEISFYSKVPYVLVEGNQFNQVDIVLTSNQKQGDLVINFDSALIAGRRFNPVVVQTKIKNDTISFDIDTEKLIDSLENLDIAGRLIPHPKGYQLTLKDNLIEMLGTKWRIDAKNSVVIGKQYIEIAEMNISDGVRSITIEDVNENMGLKIGISNFDVDAINRPLKFPKMRFEGNSYIAAFVDNIYIKDPSLRLEADIPNLTINNSPYGAVDINVVKISGKPAEVDINVGDFLGINGTYNVESKLADAKIKLRKTPMTLIQYLLVDGIKETEGFLDGEFIFKGPISDPTLDGTAYIRDGATKIIYTGAKYYFDDQKIELTNTKIDLDGAVLTDERGNRGVIKGGLYHNLFKNFGVKASLSGDNIIGLNTTSKENPNYYGFGIGKIKAEFSGSFDQINMNITAITGPGTKLSIPVNSNQSSIDKSFIQFVKRDSLSKQHRTNVKPFSVKGFDIAMAITLTPDAEVAIIFDQVKNDIIKATGRGNLKVDITRLGDFDIFGDYEIEQGQYLFTVALLPVAKPFEVERGGRIRWTGDPVNTSLDITAKYRTRTSISPFIDEYLSLVTEDIKRLADQRSEVDLKLKLGGTLYKPEIKFDLSFPNLPTEISSFTDNKLRILKANELELNSQVVGLLVFKNFIPSNRVSDLFGTSGSVSAGVTTLSEFISGQLSMAVTNIINSSLTENGLISDVDFELGVRNNFTGVNVGSNSLFPDEIEVRLKNRFSFWDERLSLNLGTNYVFQSQGQAINQVLPDFAMEMLMTDDRKMKIRFYGKYDIDPIDYTSRRVKYGLGIAYRTEFGSMLDFEKKLKQAVTGSIKEK